MGLSLLDILLIILSLMMFAGGITILCFTDFELLPTIAAIVLMIVGIMLFICKTTSFIPETETDKTLVQTEQANGVISAVRTADMRESL